MSKTIKEQIKKTGATFTPQELSVFLAEKIASYIKPITQNVIDPACGEGELLIAMGNILSDSAIDFSLTGYDANEQYLSFAQERILQFGIENTKLIHEDFLKAIDVSSHQSSLNLFQEHNKSSVNNSFDIVIANPPYVRTQILGTDQAQELARKFHLTGRVDLYYPFLIAMTESLKEGGILGVITF